MKTSQLFPILFSAFIFVPTIGQCSDRQSSDRQSSYKQSMDSLSSIYSDAIERDPTLLQKQSSLLATKELIPQAKSLLMPSVAATSSYSHADIDSKTSSDYRVESTTYGVSIKQPLLNLGAFSLWNQAEANISQVEHELQSAQNELIARVTKAYFAALTAQDAVDFAEAEKKSILKQLEQSKKRHEYGQIAATGVYEAQARYDLVIAQQIQAQNNLLSKLEALQEITDRPVGKLQPLQETIPLLQPTPNNVEEWNEIAMRRNPQLLSLLASEKAAKENISYKKSSHYPTVDLTGALQKSETDGLQEKDENTSSIGVNLSIPLFAGGSITSTVREAQYRFDQTRHSVEQVRRSLTRQIRDAFWGISSSISQVKALQQALKSNEIALEATEAGYEVGTRTMVDLLNAQTELHRAKLNLRNAKYNLVINHILLRQAAGIVSPDDVAKVNKQLSAGG